MGGWVGGCVCVLGFYGHSLNTPLTHWAYESSGYENAPAGTFVVNVFVLLVNSLSLSLSLPLSLGGRGAGIGSSSAHRRTQAQQQQLGRERHVAGQHIPRCVTTWPRPLPSR